MPNALRETAALVALFLCALGAVTWRIGAPPFFRTMEGREAFVVQEMVSSGRWILPLRNGDSIPSKPPLFHWLAAVVSLVAGRVDEATVRFPSAVSSAGTLVVTALIGRSLFGSIAGLSAALLLFATPAFVEMAREGWVDATFSFFVAAAIASFALARSGSLRPAVARTGFAFAVACAVLSKGPAGAILPALAIAAFAFVEADSGFARSFFRGPMILLGAVPPLLWYSAATIAGGSAFLSKHLWEENVWRFIHGAEGPPLPTSWFVRVFLAEGFPWSFLLLATVWDGLRRKRFGWEERFVLCWWTTIFVFFSLSAGKREVYLLPLYPATALLVAQALRHIPERIPPPPRVASAAVLAVFAVSAGILSVFAVAAATRALTADSPWIDLAFGGVRPREVFFPLQLLNERPFHMLAAAAALLVALGGGVFAFIGGRLRPAAGFLLAFFLVHHTAVRPLLRELHKEYRSLEAFALAVRERVPRDAPLRSVGLTELAHVYFYLGRHVPAARCDRLDERHCTSGYYLMMERSWRSHPVDGARQILTSRGLSGPRIREHLALVHLDRESEAPAHTAPRTGARGPSVKHGREAAIIARGPRVDGSPLGSRESGGSIYGALGLLRHRGDAVGHLPANVAESFADIMPEFVPGLRCEE